MMIYIGDRSFLESTCIDEILTPHGSRAARLKRFAAEGRMLITATEGKKAKSMIKLKTKHLVLSASEPETLRSRLRRVKSSPGSADDQETRPPKVEGMQESRSEFSPVCDRRSGLEHLAFACASCDVPDRRSGIERRRFLYTCHIPERRMGVDRRKSQ